MSQAGDPTVYRVCAGLANRWDVFQDSQVEPIASFTSKNAALIYAIGLARGRVSWELLLSGQQASSHDRSDTHPRT